MTVRDVTASDETRLRELFRKQSFEYDFPDLEEPQFIAKRVICDADGTVVMAVAARRTVELFMLADPQWNTPRMRLEALKLIHDDMRKELTRLGVHDVHAWLPPQVARSFGRRLMRLFGWKRPLWTDFCAEVNPNG
jgi:hypothetical protein